MWKETFAAGLLMLLAFEAKAWLPRVLSALIRRAVKRLPAAHRERYQEEWTAHVAETPGAIMKLWAAIGFCFAARSMFPRTATAPILRFSSRAAKRALDLMIVLPALFALGPLLIFTAIAIRLESPGPIFIRPRRVGQAGRIFSLPMFRTFRVSDGQVTRVGGFIRRAAIDQLPRLLSVLRGDMSIVGPLPVGPTTHHWLVNGGWAGSHIKPGITGLALKSHGRPLRRETYLAHRVEADSAYADGWSVLVDIKILRRAAAQVFSMRSPRD